jgi:hypothetical protein
MVSSRSNTESIRDDPILDLQREQFRTDRAVQCLGFPLYYNTESIRDDPYWTSRENSLELIELSMQYK